MKKIILLILSIFSLKEKVMSQEKTESKVSDNYNQTYDLETLNDNSIEIVENYISTPIKNQIYSQPKLENLIYDTEKKYFPDKLKEILDNPQISDFDKNKFIKTALQNSSNTFFLNFNSQTPINYLINNPEIKELIENYYKETENDIIKYFNRRTAKSLKYDDEGDYIRRLLVIGNEELALNFFELLIDDLINKKIDHLNLGERNSNSYDGYFFDLFCCSKNRSLAERSTKLLFRFLSYEDHSDLFILGKYLDETKNLRIMLNWFDYYSKINFEGLLNLDDESFKNECKIRKNIYPYFNFMLSNSEYLAPKIGKTFWQEFTSKIEYWKSFNKDQFDAYRFKMVELVFKDKTLTKLEKKDILFESDIKYTDNNISKDTFIWILSNVFPDGKLSFNDYQKIDLKRFQPYSNIIDFSIQYEIDLPIRYRSFNSDIEIDSFMKDLSIATNTKPIELTTLDYFKMHYITFLEILEKYMLNSGKVLILYGDYFKEVDYNKIFKNEINPFLESNKIDGLEFDFQKNKTKEDNYKYNLYIFSQGSGYKTEYSTHSETYFYSEKVFKLVNLKLKERNNIGRFCRIYNIDHCKFFFLAEPKKIKAFLEKYGLLFGLEV